MLTKEVKHFLNPVKQKTGTHKKAKMRILKLKQCNNQIKNLLGMFNRGMQMTRGKSCLEDKQKLPSLNKKTKASKQKRGKRKEDWEGSSVLD